MARPNKQGIDYLPFDVDFFSDIKIRKIARACGSQATSILIFIPQNVIPFILVDITQQAD